MSRQPSLKGRKMRCTYGGAEMPSKWGAAFFEYRGPNSEWAKRTCKNCNYAPEAHDPEVKKQPHLVNVVCNQFVQSEGSDTDNYYCGCYGWE